MYAASGTLLPWEVTTPLRISELVNTHTRFSGNRSLCVALFVYIMNKRKYESLPPDLKKVIDDNSGVKTSEWAGKVQNDGDIPGLEAAQKRGNAIVTLDPAETKRWKAAAAPMNDAWVNEMKGKNIDGKVLLDDLRGMIAKHAGDMAYQVGDVYAWRGEKDKAFEWLERAYQQRDSGLNGIAYDPLLAGLQGDSRYGALLKKLKLAD